VKRIQTLGGLAVFDGGRPLGGNAKQPRRLAILAAFETARASGAFEEAARLYGGPFLGDFHLPGAPEFARWAEEEREGIGADYRALPEAIREGRRAVELLPIERDALQGPYVQLQLVRIYLLTGEPEQALDQLEPLLHIPFYLSPGWLRIDPAFEPVRTHPRFERLLAGTG
jgi:hypothetical protein